MKNSVRLVGLAMSDVDGLIRGTHSEDRVERIMRFLVEMGLIYSFSRSRICDELDNAGIDFQIFLKEGGIIPLQVKSSFRGLNEHIREYGYSVPCLVVVDSDDDGQLMSKLFRITGLGRLLVSS